jgi:ferredoxin-NADP reductase
VVESVTEDSVRGLHIVMRGKDLNALGAVGGQFFVWRFATSIGGFLAGHPFSLSAAPTDTTFEIRVRIVGDGTSAMRNLTPGTRVWFEGPYGRVTGDLRERSRLVMLAAGAGIAPVISILASEQWAPGQAMLVTRNNSEPEVMGAESAQALVNSRGLVWHNIVGHHGHTSPTWLPDGVTGGRSGPDVLRELLAEAGQGSRHRSGVSADIGDNDVYLCGPDKWMHAVRADLIAAGVAHDRIHAEEFSYA